MRSKLDEQMGAVNHSLIQMGAICEEAIALAARALLNGEKQLAQKLEPLAVEMDQMERDVENMCMKLLLRQQPVAGDLRRVSAAMKLVTDMKRISDQAEDIAEIIQAMEMTSEADLEEIHVMAQAVIRMVTLSVDAFVHDNLILADRVIASDDIVDDGFDRVRESLVKMIAEDPDQGGKVLDLLMIA